MPARPLLSRPAKNLTPKFSGCKRRRKTSAIDSIRAFIRALASGHPGISFLPGHSRICMYPSFRAEWREACLARYPGRQILSQRSSFQPGIAGVPGGMHGYGHGHWPWGSGQLWPPGHPTQNALMDLSALAPRPLCIRALGCHPGPRWAITAPTLSIAQNVGMIELRVIASVLAATCCRRHSALAVSTSCTECP